MLLRRAAHAALGAVAAEEMPVDEEAQQPDRRVAVLAREDGVGGGNADAHFPAAELHANRAVAARTELGFLEHDLSVVGILGGEEKGSSIISYVGDLSHRDLLRSSRSGRGSPLTRPTSS